MKRRTLAALLIVVMSLNLAALSGCGKKSSYVTRGEWVAMLAEGFGLESYQSETPYYADVTAQSEWFPSVQATAQWGVLSVYSGDKLAPDKLVTYAEVASTAAIAGGFKANRGQADGADGFDPQPSIDYAAQYGIVFPGLDADRQMTRDECEAALDAARRVYVEMPGEERLEVIQNPELVNLSGIPLELIEIDGDRATFPDAVVDEWGQDANGDPSATLYTSNGVQTVGIGTTFVTAPTAQAPFGTAYKVTAVEALADGGAVFTTTTPALGDMYDDVDIHTTVSLDQSHVTWADGVTVTPAAVRPSTTGQDYHIELLTSSGQAGNGSGVTWPIPLQENGVAPVQTGPASTIRSGEVGEVLRDSGFVYAEHPSIEDFDGSTKSWEKPLDKKPKYSAGYKIEGNIHLDMTATSDIEYHKFLGIVDLWPKTADLCVTSDLTANLKFEGTLSGELEIGNFSIPMGASGFAVDGKLFLYAEANGSIQVKVEFINKYHGTWENPAGFRELCSESDANTEMKAALDLSVGAGVGLSISALSAKIIGVDLKAGGDLEATASVVGRCEEATQDGLVQRTYTEALRVNSAFYMPIVTVTISGPDALAEVFGLKKDFVIIGKGAAPKRTLLDKKYVFWTSVVTIGEDGEIIDTQTETLVEEDILAALRNGDFSQFAGTYEAMGVYHDWYGGGQELPDLTLDDRGVATGGMVYGSYAETAPISVTQNEDGSYRCQVVDAEYGEEYYLIYPPETIGPNPYIYNDPTLTHNTYIEYVVFDGGVSDIIYCKFDRYRFTNDNLDGWLD